MAYLSESDYQFTTPEDICAHVGDEYSRYMGAIVPPIFQNSLFVRQNPKNGIGDDGYLYTREGNPTLAIAERKVAALEGADGALCFASGMGAISAGILHFSHAGGHIIMVGTAYGPTRQFVTEYLPKMNISSTLVDGGDIDEIRSAIRENTSLIYLESPSSHIFRMQDLDAIASLAKAHNIGTVIDNTYATPLHQQPLKHGIDITVHTASKYFGGHSDIVAGVLASRREIIESIHENELALLGACMDPHQAWLMIRGLRTLPLRLKQHGESAAKVAAFLEHHPKIKKVYYPGSETYEQKELYEKYLSGGCGLMSFIPRGTAEQINDFIAELKYFQNGCSWGGFESLVIGLTVGDDLARSDQNDVPANLVRIHVGLENVDSLIADLDRALALCIPENAQ